MTDSTAWFLVILECLLAFALFVVVTWNDDVNARHHLNNRKLTEWEARQ
jgi:hypothetical protein